MRVLDVALALTAAFLIHTVFGRYVPALTESVDLFTVVAAVFGLMQGRMHGLVTGSVAGLIQDAFSGGMLGLNGMAKSTVGYLAGIAQRHLIIRGWAARVLFFVGASVVDLSIIAAVGYSAEIPVILGEGLRPVWVSLANAVAGLVAVRILEKRRHTEV